MIFFVNYGFWWYDKLQYDLILTNLFALEFDDVTSFSPNINRSFANLPVSVLSYLHSCHTNENVLMIFVSITRWRPNSLGISSKSRTRPSGRCSFIWPAPKTCWTWTTSSGASKTFSRTPSKRILNFSKLKIQVGFDTKWFRIFFLF